MLHLKKGTIAIVQLPRPNGKIWRLKISNFVGLLGTILVSSCGLKRVTTIVVFHFMKRRLKTTDFRSDKLSLQLSMWPLFQIYGIFTEDIPLKSSLHRLMVSASASPARFESHAELFYKIFVVSD